MAVYTRFFRNNARDCVKFVPLLDMSQHKDLPLANIEHYTDAKTGDCVIVAAGGGGALGPGEELFTCYAVEGGEMEPHEFFTIYGFVPGVGGDARTVRQRLEDRDDMLEDVFFDVEE